MAHSTVLALVTQLRQEGAYRTRHADLQRSTNIQLNYRFTRREDRIQLQRRSHTKRLQAKATTLVR
jgi:hypothetical protein